MNFHVNLTCWQEGMQMDESISAEELCMAAGVLLSLAFSYVPGLNERFALLSATHKRLVMLALLVLLAAGVFALSCLQAPLNLASVSCDQGGAWGLLRVLVLAVIANQSAYALSPRVSSV
jgi:hypothetical protein